MTLFVQLAFQGVALGMIYGLIALGFVIVFKGSHTFNFAHGELVALGAFVVVAMIVHLPYWLALLGALLVVGVVAAFVQGVLLKRLVSRSLMTMVLATLGISIMIHQVILMVWGVGQHGSAGPVGAGTVAVGDVVLPHAGIATIATSVALLAGLGWFFTRTTYGLGLRATASNQEAALAQGIDVQRMFVLSWVIAAGLAVVAGIFLASFPRVTDPSIGTIALIAIPAIVIGGMDSLLGAVVGGLVVGLIQVLGAHYLADVADGRLHTVLPYVLMFLVLMLRPYGLFGTRTIERV